MNFKPIAQAGSSRSISRRNPLGIWMAAVAVLLVGCDDRRDAEVTPAAASPSPKATVPSTIGQKSQVELAQMFAAAGVAVSSLKTSAELEKIKSQANVILSPQANGLKITATSHRPAVLLPGFRSETAIVELVIHNPADTALQLFYRLPGQRGFSEAQSLKKQTKTGRNVIYAELPALEPFAELRLDPGAVRGDYVFESFEAKALAAGIR